MYDWNNNTKTGIITHAKNIYDNHGSGTFFRGIHHTFLRDSLFSLVFFLLSEKYNKQKSLLNDCLFASCATIISSPVNYYRSRMYFDFNHCPKFAYITNELIEEIKKTKGNKIYYLLHNKFNVGFGTLRVGMGIALSKKIYETINTRTTCLQ